MHAAPPAAPPVADMRQGVASALRALAAQVRRGACPVAIAPAPSAPALGWSHWHPWPELFVQLAGGSRFATPVGDVRVEAGNCLLMPPMFAHVEHVGWQKKGFANLVFIISDQRMAYHLALASDASPAARPHVAQPDLIEAADHQLGRAALLGLARSGAAGAEDARAGWLLAFCTWAAAAIDAAAPPGFSGSERVLRTRELVVARLGSAALTVPQLGAWMGCHPDHLARMFRRETGETLVGHIRRQRLERARELLANRELAVADVARLVGLPDPAYFSRVFRKAYGIPPGAARRAVLEA